MLLFATIKTWRGEARASTMITREPCPQCGSNRVKKNGHFHTGKQNRRGKLCGRAFVLSPANHLLTEEQRTLIERLLLERISLRGICQAVGVGLRWLLQSMGERFEAAREHLYVMSPSGTQTVILQRLEAELDEIWSRVGQKANRPWVWIAMEITARQVVTFHVDDRSGRRAQALWEKLPTKSQEQATFYTYQYEVENGVIPITHHRAISKLARQTNPVERLNCTLRQRISRGTCHVVVPEEAYQS